SSDLRGAATMSGRRAKSFRGGRGEQVSGRRATVSNGGQRAEEKKVEERNRAFGGRPRCCCESYPSPPNAERAPCPSFGQGERVPFIEPFSPPPLDPPSPVARPTTPPLPAPSSLAFSTSALVSSRGRADLDLVEADRGAALDHALDDGVGRVGVGADHQLAQAGGRAAVLGRLGRAETVGLVAQDAAHAL